jgi:Icc-related predicted phosphoesterase
VRFAIALDTGVGVARLGSYGQEMKLHVLSDLHTEFADFSPPKTGADIVILAGDIGVGLGGIEKYRPELWIHGHTHVPCEYELFDTQVVCNPGGYPGENRHSDFRDDLVVSVS